MVTWYHDDIVTWRHGDLVTYQQGDMVTLWQSDMATWSYGDTATCWQCDMVIWCQQSCHPAIGSGLSVAVLVGWAAPPATPASPDYSFYSPCHHSCNTVKHHKLMFAILYQYNSHRTLLIWDRETRSRNLVDARPIEKNVLQRNCDNFLRNKKLQWKKFVSKRFLTKDFFMKKFDRKKYLWQDKNWKNVLKKVTKYCKTKY